MIAKRHSQKLSCYIEKAGMHTQKSLQVGNVTWKRRKSEITTSESGSFAACASNRSNFCAVAELPSGCRGEGKWARSWRARWWAMRTRWLGSAECHLGHAMAPGVSVGVIVGRAPEKLFSDPSVFAAAGVTTSHSVRWAWAIKTLCSARVDWGGCLPDGQGPNAVTVCNR